MLFLRVKAFLGLGNRCVCVCVFFWFAGSFKGVYTIQYNTIRYNVQYNTTYIYYVIYAKNIHTFKKEHDHFRDNLLRRRKYSIKLHKKNVM